MITWQQLGIHHKPIGCLNVGGFFEPFRQLIEQSVDSGFINERFRSMVILEDNPEALINALANQKLPESVITWTVPEV